MKNSLLLLAVFILGGIAGFSFPESMLTGFHADNYILFGLMFVVGVNTGSNPDFLKMLRQIDYRMAIVPFITISGTYAGLIVFAFFFSDNTINELLAIGSGFGYYSLSSMIISDISGEGLALVALLSNIFREILTIIITPMLVKYTGGLSPIASAGATSMDTSLPVIIRYAGQAYVFPAVFNGVVLTVLVPFLVVFFLGLQ